MLLGKHAASDSRWPGRVWAAEQALCGLGAGFKHRARPGAPVRQLNNRSRVAVAHSSDLAPFAHIGTGEANTLKFCYCTPGLWCDAAHKCNRISRQRLYTEETPRTPSPKKSVRAQLPSLHSSRPRLGSVCSGSLARLPDWQGYPAYFIGKAYHLLCKVHPAQVHLTSIAQSLWAPISIEVRQCELRKI